MTKKDSEVPAQLERVPNLSNADHFGLERLVFFSDAVFAIAITLLALDIRLPTTESALTNEELLQNLLAIWPKYLGFVLSFLIIGAFWIGHHRRFRFIKRYDSRLLFLNLLLLMSVAFIPFPTSLISEHGNRISTIFYALNMIVTGLLSAIIWWYASHGHRLIDAEITPQQIRRDMLRQFVVPAVFFLSVGLAFIDTDLAKFSWVLTAPISVFIR